MTSEAQQETQALSEFRLGEWDVLPASNQLRKNGELVSLQNLSMQVLVYLANRAGDVVTYDELLDQLWAGRTAGEDAIHRRVADLRRHLGDRREDPLYIETIPKRGYRLIAKVGAARKPTPKPRRRFALVAATLVATVALTAMLRNGGPPPGADGVAVPPVNNDPTLIEVAIESMPPDAMVFYKPYGDDGDEWQSLGATPLETELPEGTAVLRIVADGYEPAEIAAPNPSRMFNNVDRDFYTIQLAPQTEVPHGMVYVPAGEHIVPMWGIYERKDIGEYFIGRNEVSNSEFAVFVDARGYSDPVYWRDLEGQNFNFGLVAERFVDSSGEPGPAGWTDGRYPEGEGNLPVTGVSWYEAMAYAKFRDAQLPTAWHWARAALGVDENSWPLARDLLKAANLDGTGPIPANDARAMSTFGATNLIGNVREWMTTRMNETNLSLGIGFRGPEWGYSFPGAAFPMQRGPDQGFRLAKYDPAFPDPSLEVTGLVPSKPEVSAATFQEFAKLFEYSVGAVGPENSRLESTTTTGNLVREKYVIETDMLPEPLPVIVFRPANVDTPVQSILYLPPGSSYDGSYGSDEITLERFNIGFIVESGRALVWPIIAGTHERHRPRPILSRDQISERWLRAKQLRRAEIGAVIDFLDGHAAFDGDRVGLLAASFGAAIVSPHIIATEPRIKTVVLTASSIAAVRLNGFPDAVNPNTYWAHIRTPILLLNGRYDISTHATRSRDDLYLTIGTDTAHKRNTIYDSSHWPLPQHRVRQDATDWFDRYLGPPAE